MASDGTYIGDNGEQSPQPTALYFRCQSCQDAIEITDRDSVAEIQCPSCGCRFRLRRSESAISVERVDTVERQQQYAHFELFEKIGEGAFGIVWKSRDTKLDRMVALKVPRKGKVDLQDFERFLREARAAAQLHHPNIVTVFQVGVEETLAYIATELVDGLPLDQWLAIQNQNTTKNAKRLPAPQTAIRLCAKIADALQYAHQRGIIHRDLKPANILIDDHGEPHITDFGLAKCETGETTIAIEGQILGTIAYMSPEQANGASHTADGRSDVYSLGVILFEMLTGQRPFQGSTPALLKQVIVDEAPSPRKLDARIPRDLETICLKCLEKEPHRRYANAGELVHDLHHFLAGEPIHARPVSRAERFWRWCRRNPAESGLAAAVAATLLIGAVTTGYFAVETTAQAHYATAQKGRADLNAAHAEQQKLCAQKARYANELALAQRAIEDGDYIMAQNSLARTNGALRGWAYRYLQAAIGRRMAILDGHTEQVSCVVFSPDGRHIVSSGNDRTLRLWDAVTGKLIRTMKGHTGWVSSVAFSPDGKQIVSGSWDKTVRIWDTATGQTILTLPAHFGAVLGVAFGPNGRQVASAGGGDMSLRVWDIKTGKEAANLQGHMGVVWGVAFSPDGKRIASGSNDNTVKVWDIASGKEIHSLDGHAGWVWSVAFSPDGKRIVSGSWDETIKVWDAVDGRNLLTIKGCVGPVLSVAFSPDEKRIVSGSADQALRVWDATTGQLCSTLKGHTAEVASVAFGPDGKRIVSGGGDKTVRIWELEANRGYFTLKGQVGEASCAWMAFSRDCRRVALPSENNTVGVWDIANPGDRASRSLQNTERMTKSVPLADKPGGSERSLTLAGHAAEVCCAAFSLDGALIVSGGSDKTLRVWDATDGRERFALNGHDAEVESIAFSPDGQNIVSGSRDGMIIIWDTANQKVLHSIVGHKGGIRCLAFCPDGTQIVSAGKWDKMLKVWDVATAKQQHSLTGHAGWIFSASFSPDGKQIISVGSDNTVKLWDAASGKESFCLVGFAGEVQGVAFSPDGRQIVTMFRDGTNTIWDAADGQEVFSFKGPIVSTLGVAFSADGRRIASAGADSTLMVWDATTENSSTASRFRLPRPLKGLRSESATATLRSTSSSRSLQR